MLEQLDDSTSLTRTHSDLGCSGTQLWVESGWALCLPGWLVSNHLSGLGARVGSEAPWCPHPLWGSTWELTDNAVV